MDEREDYADFDHGPRWEPSAGMVIVVGFAAAVLVGCVTFTVFFGLLLGGGR